MRLKNVLGMLKGESRRKTAENYSIAFLLLGAVLLASGIGLNIVTTVGVPTILAMAGALITFLATVSLIVIWLMGE